MFITLFCFICIIAKYRNNINLNLSNLNNIMYTSTDVSNTEKDNRFANSTYDDKINILIKLESNQISEINKIKIIKENNILESDYRFNITTGGLLDDFYL